jgi:hypothetical protein
MLLQTSIGQALFSFVNPQNIFTIMVEIGVFYIAYREFKIKIETKTNSHDKRLDVLEDEQIKIVGLQTDSKLLQKDIDSLKSDFENQNRLLAKLDDSNSKIKEDIHKIKGSMISIEHYFKMIIDKDK